MPRNFAPTDEVLDVDPPDERHDRLESRRRGAQSLDDGLRRDLDHALFDNLVVLDREGRPPVADDGLVLDGDALAATRTRRGLEGDARRLRRDPLAEPGLELGMEDRVTVAKLGEPTAVRVDGAGGHRRHMIRGVPRLASDSSRRLDVSNVPAALDSALESAYLQRQPPPRR